MTVTVIQGRGTAHYTPLEQYGGDSGHTDPRSDVYTFGATLYHLLTNTAPAEAKHRFLDPKSLRAPHDLNPDVDPALEQVVLWAMALHPDDRPQTASALRQALSSGIAEAGTLQHLSSPFDRLAHLLPSPVDQGLAIATISLLLLSLVGYLR